MWDRQYFTSLALFVFAAVTACAGVAFLLLFLGWPGLVALLAMAAGFLGWFYWGPRPDLKPRARGDRMDDSGNA